jgi:hypothetical protein
MRPTGPITIIFLTLLLSLIVVSCSYQFEEPPFEDSQLVNITETKFGQELLSTLEDIPDTDQTSDIKEGVTDDSLVLEVSEDFLIQQQLSEETNGWELTVITKNSHHIMFCSIMQQDEDGEIAVTFPENVEFKKDEEGQIWLWGDKTAVAEFALELSLSSPKLCLAVPYLDASKMASEGLVAKTLEAVKEVIREVPVEVIVEKEVIREVPVEIIVEKEIIREIPVEVIVEKEVIREVPVEASGGCNRANSVSALTGTTNSLMLFGPLLFIAGYRGYRRRHK